MNDPASRDVNEPNRPTPNLRYGYLALALFAALGLALETLHAFKAGFYLDAGQETRRLLWCLAHAHGTLLGLVNIAYALSVARYPALADPLSARALLVALVLMPLGFASGGAFAHGGDPGASVSLAAAGGLALVVGLARTALRAK